jgi:hypothetical protein
MTVMNCLYVQLQFVYSLRQHCCCCTIVYVYIRLYVFEKQGFFAGGSAQWAKVQVVVASQNALLGTRPSRVTRFKHLLSEELKTLMDCHINLSRPET